MYNKQRGIRRVWLPGAQTPLERVFLTLELSSPGGLITEGKMSSEWVVEEGGDGYHWQPQPQLQSWGLHSISLTSFGRFPLQKRCLWQLWRSCSPNMGGEWMEQRVNYGEGGALSLLASASDLKI